MKIDTYKMNECLAKKGFNASDLRGHGIAYNTILRARRGEETTPKTVNKIAQLLGVDVTEILADKEE